MADLENLNLDGIKALEPQIRNICKVGGAPGLSLAVIQHGEAAYVNHFGYRNVATKEALDGDTIYFIGSLTKAMVSALAGICVEEGVLEWTTPIASILPQLDGTFSGRGSQMTIVDLLSHRVGVARGDALWLQRAGNILMPKSKGFETWTSQPLVRDFRTDYLYSNFCYDMVGRAIEKVTGKTLGTNLKERIFQPLNMCRTSLENDIPDASNAAKAYFALDDGTPFEVPVPSISDKTLMSAAGSVRSTTNDLIKFYTGFLQAAKHQFLHISTQTPGSPFKQLLRILRPHSQLNMISIREQSYALGWGRAELPATLGAFNYNKYLVPNMPLIGENAPSLQTIYHGGSMQGFTTAVYLLPETETVVLALQNSTGLCDPCDWVSQLVVHTLSGTGAQPIDFNELVSTASINGANIAAKIEKQLQEGRQHGTKPRDLSAYVGRYYNDGKTFHITIAIHEGALYMTFQSIQSETYKLSHYHHDVWVWNSSHNETAKQGRFQTRPMVSYKIDFEGIDDIQVLRWMYDAEHSVPGTFVLEKGSR